MVNYILSSFYACFYTCRHERQWQSREACKSRVLNRFQWDKKYTYITTPHTTHECLMGRIHLDCGHILLYNAIAINTSNIPTPQNHQMDTLWPSWPPHIQQIHSQYTTITNHPNPKITQCTMYGHCKKYLFWSQKFPILLSNPIRNKNQIVKSHHHTSTPPQYAPSLPLLLPNQNLNITLQLKHDTLYDTIFEKVST